jgi:hypothetical protein
MKKQLATLAICIGLVVAIGAMQERRLNDLQNQTVSDQDLLHQNAITAANLALAQRIPTFGFDNLIANWFFLQFLQYFGDTPSRQKIGYSLSPEYFRVILSNDPYYRTYYIFMSGSVSNFAAQPEASIEMLKQGLEQMTPTFPNDSFYLWRYKGVDQLLFLGDGVAAQQSFQSASDWARQSSHPDAALIAKSSQQTANFLANNPNSRLAQINAWLSVLGNAFDDATRQRTIERIEALGGRIIPNADGSFSVQLPDED